VESAEQARITLIGRTGCHLCDEAKAVVLKVDAELQVGVLQLAVDDDPELNERYGEMVPVVLIDGRQHDYWRISEARLRQALTGRRGWLGTRRS